MPKGVHRVAHRTPFGGWRGWHSRRRQPSAHERHLNRLVAMLLCLICGAPASTVFALQVLDVEDPFAAPRLRLEHSVTIRGTPRGEPALTAPRSLLADSSAIYVLDPSVFGVHRFDRRGNWLGTIGAEGDGPGEFRRPTDMGWSSDTLWIADLALGRLSFINRHSDAFSRQIQFRITTVRSITVPRRMLGSSILSVPQFLGDEAADADSVPFLLMNEEGSVHDTLGWRAVGRRTVSVPVGTNSERQGSFGTLTLSHPFDVRSLTALDPRSRWLYVGTWRSDRVGEDYFELAQISPVADTVIAVRLPFPRNPVRPEDVESYARSMHEVLSEAVRAHVSAEELAEELSRRIRDPRQSTVDAMMAGEDQVIWFRRTILAEEERRERRWAAYRFKEGFVGVAVLPKGHDLLAVTRELLWTTSRDGFGLPTIMGWRVSWPEPVAR